MPTAAIIKDLKAKKIPPILILHGEESYFIDQISDYIEHHILNESEQSFDQSVYYGKDISARDIMDMASRYPVIAAQQVIIIKEAQDFKEYSQLTNYIKNPTSTTLLVFCYKHGKLDARTTFYKALKDHAVIFESKKIPDNSLVDWVSKQFSNHKLNVMPDALQLFTEYLGNDLSKITNEIEKLSLNVVNHEMITTALIEKYIGISKDYNFFELQKAIATRNKEKIYNILNYFDAQPKQFSIIPCIVTLYNFFSRVYMLAFTAGKSKHEICSDLGIREFFLKDYEIALKNFPKEKTILILNYLSEYDLKSKGVNQVNINDSALLKELTWKILHC